VTIPTFAERRRQWSNPPVDDIGYIASTDLLAMGDAEFAATMQAMWHNRYEGWRNWRGQWVEMFGMHEGGIEGKRVLDYGCGVGMEGAQFANLGNKVYLADISPDNLKVAKRLLALYDKKPVRSIEVGPKPPFLIMRTKVDVIHCAGVLHHIPKPVPVIKAMHGWLAEGGRLNLMLYSDVAWRMATGKHALPEVVSESPFFEKFWTRWDAYGGYADWYNENKLREWFGEWFDIAQCSYLTRNREYLGAVLVKR